MTSRARIASAMHLSKPDQIRADIRQRLAIGKTASGFILGTACATAPSTPAAHVALLREVVDLEGWY